jgi:XPG domain containing
MRPSRLLRSHSSAVKRAQLPGNPFMVSAVTEDLKSRWTAAKIKSTLPKGLVSVYESNVDDHLSDLTEIVPGEADVFCAALAAQKPGTAILTSDSDLFLYELGSDSSIILFDTIYAETWDDEDPTQSLIKAMRFCPTSISDRLGIPALSYLAHEMGRSPRSTFVELVRRAKNAAQSEQKTAAYVAFLKEYDLSNFQYNPAKGHVLQNFDTRTSELLAQCFWRDEFQDQAPRIYLPFLVEDHSRRCAWAEGARIRRLAYSLINLNTSVKEKYPAMTECVRRGRRFCFDDVALYSNEEDIETEATRLIDALEFIQDKKRQSSPLFWRIFALYEIHTDWFTSQDIPPQDYRNGLKTFLGLDSSSSSSRDEVDAIDWDNVHALAQLQAVLYSLRMVFQIIRDLELADGPVRKLCGLLDGLPPLHVLMRSFHEVRRELHDT